MKTPVVSALSLLGIATLVPTTQAFERPEPPPNTIEASFLNSPFGIGGLTFGVKASASFPELALDQANAHGFKIGAGGLTYDVSASAKLFPESSTERAIGTASARYNVGDGSLPDTFSITFSGDLKTLTEPPPDILRSSAEVNLSFSLSGRVRGTGDGTVDAHIALPLPKASGTALPPGATELASAFVKIYDKDGNLTQNIDLNGIKSANGLYDLYLDAGQLFYYETTYTMNIEDRVDPPFSFTLNGSAGVFVPEPAPVPVPEIGWVSLPVMGALAGGLLWRRRKA